MVPGSNCKTHRLQYYSWLFSLESSLKDYWGFPSSLLIFQSHDPYITILHCWVFLSPCVDSHLNLKGVVGRLDKFISPSGLVRWHHPFQGKPLFKYGPPQYRTMTFFLGISYHFSLFLKPQPSVGENILSALGFQRRISKSLTYISGTVANLCGGRWIYMVCLVLRLIYSMCAVFGPEVRVSLKVHSSVPEGLR